jgi:hypothetical protein
VADTPFTICRWFFIPVAYAPFTFCPTWKKKDERGRRGGSEVSGNRRKRKEKNEQIFISFFVFSFLSLALSKRKNSSRPSKWPEFSSPCALGIPTTTTTTIAGSFLLSRVRRAASGLHDHRHSREL